MIVSTDGPSLPPGDFVSEAMVVAVMASAQRHRELAPIQVTAWGNATGTGLPTIDCSPIPSRFPNRYAISSRSRSLIFRARSLSSRLRKIRHELPDLIDGCCSPAAYTRAVEEAYRTMWEKYCGGQTTAWSTYTPSPSCGDNDGQGDMGRTGHNDFNARNLHIHTVLDFAEYSKLTRWNGRAHVEPFSTARAFHENAATRESSRGRSPRPRPRSQPSPIESAWQRPLYQKTTATATAATIPHMRPIAITVCIAKPILD
jgi:hypothetical protein